MNEDDPNLPPLPPALQELDPALVNRWRLSDDAQRGRAIEEASDQELQLLATTIDQPVLMAIDEYLDQFGGLDPELVVWLHDIAQAALEAGFELRRRHP